MSELDDKYKKKKDLIQGLKDLFYENKAMFVSEFNNFSLSEQANVIAFLQVNDSKFLREINKYIDMKGDNMTKVTITSNDKSVTVDTKDLPKIAEKSAELAKDE